MRRRRVLVLVGDAARRLATFLAVISLIWVFQLSCFMATAGRGAGPEVSTLAFEPACRLMLTLCVLIASACIAAHINGKALNANRLYRVSALYFLILSVCSALHDHIALWGRAPDGWSGVALLIILFPVVVPVAPRHVLRVGLLLALCDGLCLGLMRALGHPPIELLHLTSLYRDDLGALGVALGVASLLGGLRLSLDDNRRIGRYELLEKLGEGGMGEVWRVRHTELPRAAAIKLIRPRLLDQLDDEMRALVRRRFELEIRATAAMRSPHHVELYEHGVEHDGTHYYVMELLEGLDLRNTIKKTGPMPPERAIYVLLQVCDALSEAHARGLVHRDLKPSNLFVCGQGQHPDFVKLLDFGLAKLLDSSQEFGAPPSLVASSRGAIAGTPAFMSPEQVLGDAIDTRSDVYLLGCVAYFLLSGDDVFASSSSTTLMYHHVNTKPLPLRLRAPSRLPGCLNQLVMQCLEKRPELRPSSVAAIARSLRQIPLENPWTRERASAWWSEHRDAMAKAPRSENAATVRATDPADATRLEPAKRPA